MIVNGFNSNRAALRELIFTSAMVIVRSIDYAHKVFEQITEPDLFMWNTMIRGSAQSYNPLKAVLLYTQMDIKSVRPDCYTFPFLLKACSKLGWVRMGCEVHGKVVKFGYESDTFVRNTLIYFHANCGELKVARMLFEGSGKCDVVAWSALTAGYARRGELEMARSLFDEMPEKDLVSWNVMITGYAKRGEMESARKLFDEVPLRDVVTWNAMIAGYVDCGSYEQAFKIYEEMLCAGERPDEVTMLCLLSACTDSGELSVGKRIHHSIMEKGSTNSSLLLGNALIDMYAKCGSIETSLEVFRGMRERDVSTWNSIIGGLAFHGHANESINLFTEMQREKMRPDDITFVGVLVACSHGGMVIEGRQYFDLMKNVYGIEPNIKHYGCMVDLLGRAGLLEEAFDFVDGMEIQPNPIIWRTLLGACRNQGNVTLGKRSNEQLLAMRPDQSGDYVLLSNIYASTGEWDSVEKVRKLMDDRGVMKEAGRSTVDSNNKELMNFLFESKPRLNSRVNML
ncbi:Pentatricopeptide repeat-containing protein [Thalictrum thalictroides]|uniref:Pentatricopeptide repeat-containing protein n=1 Tax=Thalictrum thalictroides TaxID=46969 RepID=A0A7J6X517_THATH|nr:Pentatricopeptide repeat-containing protein [Thalictrum thalictroides]